MLQRALGRRSGKGLVTKNLRSTRLLFIQVADLHAPYDKGGLDRFIEIVNNFLPKVGFVVFTGDAIDSGDIIRTTDVEKVNKLYKTYAEKVRRLKVPFYNVIGDHDLALSLNPELREYHSGVFKKFFGSTYYSFDYLNYHFIVLDLYPHGLGHEDSEVYEKDWLRQDLVRQPKNRPIIVFTHQPIYTTKRYSEFLKIVKGYNLVAIICGHFHGNGIEKRDGLQYIMTGTLCGRVTSSYGAQEDNPPGYRIFLLKNGKLDSFYAALENPHYTNLVHPERRSLVRGDVLVRAKVLDVDSQVKKVYCRIGNSLYVSMQLVENNIWKTCEASIDTINIDDGFNDLEIVASSGAENWIYRTTIVIDNHKPYAPKEDAELYLIFSSINTETLLMCNGKEIGKVADIDKKRELHFSVPRDVLRKVNIITLRSIGLEDTIHNYDDFTMKNVRMQYGGKRYTDITLYPDYPYAYVRCYIVLD